VLQIKEHALIPFSSIVFILGLAFESFQEFGGASQIFMWLKDWKNIVVLNLKIKYFVTPTEINFQIF
jgi:hypothetical protein